MKLRRILAVIGVLALACIAAIAMLLVINPNISVLATPRWEVWVVDESGHPLQGMTVRLSWAYYSAEIADYQEDLQTDEHGYAVFPARTFSTSVKDRFLGPIRSAREGVNASFSPHAFIFAFGRGLEGDAMTGNQITDWNGKPDRMQSRIVAKTGS